MQNNNNLVLAYKSIMILLALTVCLAIISFWFWYKYQAAVDSRTNTGMIFQVSYGENIIQKAFPSVDFSKIYPDLTSNEIDILQKESFLIRYVYTPFTQFKPMPIKKKFVEITENGYRKGLSEQPWPPNKNELSVFVFGGSTTFSYALPNEQSVVSCIERELGNIIEIKVSAYNFGRGYYFSTQERLLFEKLLQEGIIPDIAIFIDGLNDYYYPDGKPQLTYNLYQYTSPDLPRLSKPDFSSGKEKKSAVKNLLHRYQANSKILEGISEKYGITLILVGQPVPVLHYPVNSTTYPFGKSFGGHELCAWGYHIFEQYSKQGKFGKHFIWLGNIFSNARSTMYADSIHYSYKGAQVLANAIVAKSLEYGRLSQFQTGPNHQRRNEASEVEQILGQE